MADTWPDDETGLSLVWRLLDDDVVAPSDFAAAYLPPLLAFLRATQPGCDEHALVTAAEDAILSVLRRPTVYDPALSDLPAFLRMSAVADLRNSLRSESRHSRNREERECVELPAPSGNELPDEDSPSFNHPSLAETMAAFTAVEREVLELMRAGERQTAVFAAVLGLGEIPAGEQAAEVKRVKDRIKARLKRAVEGS